MLIQDFRIREQQLIARNASLNSMLRVANDKLESALERTGELWVGEFHASETVARKQPSSLPATVSFPSNARRIFGRVLLAPKDSLFGEIELHECSPGGASCMSGGSLSLQDSAGQILCTTPLSFLSNGRSGYKLHWSDSTQNWGESRKIELLRLHTRNLPNMDCNGWRTLLNEAYGPQPANTLESEEAGRKTLVLAILAKVLNDRVARSHEQKPRTGATNRSLNNRLFDWGRTSSR